LLSDISYFYSSKNMSCVKNQNDSHVTIDKDTMYVSTWFAAGNRKHINTYGITFDCLYSLFEELCSSHFNFKLSDLGEPIEFFPSINYDKFYTKNITKPTGNNVLICNGKALSGQSNNFDMTPTITILANKYKNVNFILTNKEGQINLDNVKYASDLIGKQNGCDLNEISYLSTFCKIIAGRASGPLAFCTTKKNLFERNDLSLISFSTTGYMQHSKYWLGKMFCDKLKYSADTSDHDVTNTDQAVNIISSAIERRCK